MPVYARKTALFIKKTNDIRYIREILRLSIIKCKMQLSQKVTSLDGSLRYLSREGSTRGANRVMEIVWKDANYGVK